MWSEPSPTSSDYLPRLSAAQGHAPLLTPSLSPIALPSPPMRSPGRRRLPARARTRAFNRPCIFWPWAVSPDTDLQLGQRKDFQELFTHSAQECSHLMGFTDNSSRAFWLTD